MQIFCILTIQRALVNITLKIKRIDGLKLEVLVSMKLKIKPMDTLKLVLSATTIRITSTYLYVFINYT
jgi:hypothetical protein